MAKLGKSRAEMMIENISNQSKPYSEPKPEQTSAGEQALEIGLSQLLPTLAAGLIAGPSAGAIAGQNTQSTANALMNKYQREREAVADWEKRRAEADAATQKSLQSSKLSIALDLDKAERDAAKDAQKLAAMERVAGIKALGEGAKAPKLTESQTNAALFANMAELGEKQLKDYRAGLTDKIKAAVLPNVLLPQEQRQALQGARAISEAYLRKVSGANVPASEIEAFAKTFTPSPGDDAATLLAKKQQRENIISNLRVAAGPAYQPPREVTSEPMKIGANEAAAFNQAAPNFEGMSVEELKKYLGQ